MMDQWAIPTVKNHIHKKTANKDSLRILSPPAHLTKNEDVVKATIPTIKRTGFGG